MPNILIIEDQAALRESLVLALEGPGNCIRCAGNGEAGLAILREWQADVVVVDYMMPGMDGVETIIRIKEDYGDGNIVWAYCNTPIRMGRKPRIIMLSAMMDEDLLNEARKAGADWCLGKPFDLDILRNLVKTFSADKERMKRGWHG